MDDSRLLYAHGDRWQHDSLAPHHSQDATSHPRECFREGRRHSRAHGARDPTSSSERRQVLGSVGQAACRAGAGRSWERRWQDSAHAAHLPAHTRGIAPAAEGQTNSSGLPGGREQPASILTTGYSRSHMHQHVPGAPRHPQSRQGAPQLLPEQGRAEDRVAGHCHSPGVCSWLRSRCEKCSSLAGGGCWAGPWGHGRPRATRPEGSW